MTCGRPLPEGFRVGLVPQDDRPVSLDQVLDLGAAAGIEVLAPPRDLLGHRERPGDPEAILEWMAGISGQVRAWVVALDMVAYGGLLASRRGEVEAGTASSRLDRLAVAVPDGVPIEAFQSLRRLSVTVSRSSDLAEWQRRHQEPGIDPTRARSHAVNLHALDLLADGTFRGLALLQEDCRPEGPHRPEQAALAARARELGIEARLVLAPGTDEGAWTSLARLAGVAPGASVGSMAAGVPDLLPLRIRPSSPEGAARIAAYEDRPVLETALLQARAAGFRPSGEAATELWLWCPDRAPRDLWLEGACPTCGDSRELAAFVSGLASAIEAGRRVVLADAAYANGADPELLTACAARGLLGRLSAYAGWNTAANALGSALASARLAPGSRRLLAARLVEDWGYQVEVRPLLAAEVRTRAGNPDPWCLDPETRDALEVLATRELDRWARARLPGLVASVSGVRLPWSRLFEADVEIGEAKA